MAESEHTAVCGLPSWTGMVINNTASHINHILLAFVNGSFAIFAFLSNMAIIVTVFKKSTLQKPSNILLCSLAFADFLTGVTVQPMFIVWRLFLQRAQQSCLHQVLVFDVYYTLNIVISGLSFALVMIMSFDRYYACSRPLMYHTKATKKGAMKIVTITSIIWSLLTILIVFVLRPPINHIVISTCGVSFLVAPVVNYFRILFAIRRHNSQVISTVASQQLSAVFQREKAVAVTMYIVAILLLVSLMPALCMEIVRKHYPRAHAIVFPWGLTMALITSSANPLVYFGRNQNLRKALKSILLS